MIRRCQTLKAEAFDSSKFEAFSQAGTVRCFPALQLSTRAVKNQPHNCITTKTAIYQKYVAVYLRDFQDYVKVYFADITKFC